MSTCARAASACCWACRTRAWDSVASIRATTCPALTRSPSRSTRPCNSPATRALTKAELLARSGPAMARLCTSSSVCTRSTSAAASSSTAGTCAANCCAASSAFCACRVEIKRSAPAASSANTRTRINHLSQDFILQESPKGPRGSNERTSQRAKPRPEQQCSFRDQFVPRSSNCPANAST